MIPRSSAPLYAGTANAASVPRAAVRAYLATVAGLGAMVTAVMLMMSVAANQAQTKRR